MGVYFAIARAERERREAATETDVFSLCRYGMRERPHDSRPYRDCRPGDGPVCVAEGGTVDGVKHYDFIYCIDRPNRETVYDCDPDYPGVKFPKAEEM